MTDDTQRISRWARAAELAQQVPLESTYRSQRRAVDVAVVVVLAVLCAVVVWRAAGASSADTPLPWLILLLALILASMAGVFALIVWMVVTDARQQKIYPRSPLLPAEKRHVWWQVMGIAKVEPSHLPVALGYARFLRRSMYQFVPVFLLLLGGVTVQLVTLPRQPSVLMWMVIGLALFAVVFFASFLVCMLYVPWRFLRIWAPTASNSGLAD